MRSCMISPACKAPDSEIAPARRLMIIAFGESDGVTRAKKSCVSFEIPDTGLRSVSPRARTPMIESRRARKMAIRVEEKGMRLPKTVWTAAMQKNIDRTKRIVVVCVLTRCSGGASGSSISPGSGEPVEDWREV